MIWPRGDRPRTLRSGPEWSLWAGVRCAYGTEASHLSAGYRRSSIPTPFGREEIFVLEGRFAMVGDYPAGTRRMQPAQFKHANTPDRRRADFIKVGHLPDDV
jgi:hypothetical protein